MLYIILCTCVYNVHSLAVSGTGQNVVTNDEAVAFVVAVPSYSADCWRRDHQLSQHLYYWSNQATVPADTNWELSVLSGARIV